MSLSVSLEEVLDARRTLLHVTETEAILLQLLRHLSPYQIRDVCSDVADDGGDLSIKHILLEASGQIQLHRTVAHKRWSVSQLARTLAGICIGTGIGARPPLHDLTDPSIRSLSIDRAVQILKQRIQPATAARHVSALYSQVLGSCSPLMNSKGPAGGAVNGADRTRSSSHHGYLAEGYSSTEDSAISSEPLSRHPSNDSIDRLTPTGTNSTSKTSENTSRIEEHHLQDLGVFRRRRPIRLARTRSSVADVGTGGLRSWATAASAAIQRGPSRLYRLNEQPSTQSLMLLPGVTAHPRRSRSFRDLKMSPERSDSSFTTESVDPVSPAVSASLSCCGPEFIVKNNLLPHIITLSHPPKKRRAVVILHLDGRRLQVDCDPSKTKISQLLQVAAEHFAIGSSDSIFFGLSTIKNGQFVFPRSDDKVTCLAPDNYKQLSYPSFNIYFRFRFYINSVFLLHNTDSEHLLYLQLRKDVLESRWVLDPMEEMGLAALALTIEFGPYNDKVHGVEGSYFHIDHYLSAGTQRSVSGGELAAQALERLHARIPRLTERRVAESNFVKRIMQTQSYGFHHVHAIEDDGLRTTPLNLLVGLEGLKMVPHASAGTSGKHTSLHWEDVKNVTHTKHHIVLTSTSGSTTRKRRLCVGTSRCRDTFDLITAHEKMAQELRERKMIIRPEPSSTMPRQQRVRPMSCNDNAVMTAPAYKANTLPRPVSEVMTSYTTKSYDMPLSLPPQPARSPSPVRPANAVRIYVPFGNGKSETSFQRKSEPDITTRMIEVQVESPVPELVRMPPSSPCSSTTMGSMDRLDLSGPSSPRKSTLVRMGTKITADAFIREKMRLQETSFMGRAAGDPSGAYVVDTSVKSEDESFASNEQESISQSLVERFNRLPESPSFSVPRRGVTIRFAKDPDGSLGILIARGVRGGIFLMGLTPNGPAHRQTSLKPGDRILSVNGVSCDHQDYNQVIDQLRNISGVVELQVLQQDRQPCLETTPLTLKSP